MRVVLLLIVLCLGGDSLHSAAAETVVKLFHEDAQNTWGISSALETDYMRAAMTRTEHVFSVDRMMFHLNDCFSIGRLVYRGIAARVHRHYRPLKLSSSVLKGIMPPRAGVYTKAIQPQALFPEGSLLIGTEYERYGVSTWYTAQDSDGSAGREFGLHASHGNGELALLQRQDKGMGGQPVSQKEYTAAGFQLKADSKSFVQCAATMGLRWFPALPASFFSQINLKTSFGRAAAGIRSTYIGKYMYPGTSGWQQLKEALTTAGSIGLVDGLDLFVAYQRLGFWDSPLRAEQAIHCAIEWNFRGGDMLLSSHISEKCQAGGKAERTYQYEGRLQIISGTLKLHTGRRVLWDKETWQTEVDVVISAEAFSSECTLSFDWKPGGNRPELSAAIQVTLSEGVGLGVSRKQQKSVALLRLRNL